MNVVVGLIGVCIVCDKVLTVLVRCSRMSLVYVSVVVVVLLVSIESSSCMLSEILVGVLLCL